MKPTSGYNDLRAEVSYTKTFRGRPLGEVQAFTVASMAKICSIDESATRSVF